MTTSNVELHTDVNSTDCINSKKHKLCTYGNGNHLIKEYCRSFVEVKHHVFIIIWTVCWFFDCRVFHLIADVNAYNRINIKASQRFSLYDCYPDLWISNNNSSTRSIYLRPGISKTWSNLMANSLDPPKLIWSSLWLRFFKNLNNLHNSQTYDAIFVRCNYCIHQSPQTFKWLDITAQYPQFYKHTHTRFPKTKLTVQSAYWLNCATSLRKALSLMSILQLCATDWHHCHGWNLNFLMKSVIFFTRNAN